MHNDIHLNLSADAFQVAPDLHAHANAIKQYFLIPLMVVLVVMTVLLVWQQQHHIKADIDHDAQRLRTSIVNLLEGGIGDNAHTLGATMEAIHTDPLIVDAFARHDRTALLQRSAPLFATLRRDYGITHWYFTTPDRVNLLRVHQPARHGDTIDRATTLEAEHNQRPAYGIELGPLGTFTLRFVEPWYADGQLLGYVELGVEIDHILKKIQALTDTRMFLLIEKRFLQRQSWEAGMAMLGRSADWDQLPNEVISIQASTLLEPALISAFAADAIRPASASVRDHSTVQRLIVEPVRDAGGTAVGRLVALMDVSAKARESRKSLYTASAIGGIGTLTLLALFYFLLSRVELRLASADHSLRELATHDALTGLYNLRSFHAFMADEVARSLRSTSPFSVLMIDIDHFKRINDTYGHPVGDEVLHHISGVLRHTLRSIDRLCRYGGEEFVAILPNSGTRPVQLVAERVRAAVAATPYELADGRLIPITVSIGAATYPDHAGNEQELLSGADSALYQAKRDGRNRVQLFSGHD